MRAKHVLPTLILLLAAPLAAAQVNSTPGEWRRLGPDGGQVDDLAVAPGNPKVVYASAQGAIYRSRNGGATWALASDDVFSLQLTVDAANPFLVYGTDGDVYRSLDGGATWATLDGPDPYSVRQVVAHPRIANTVFAATTTGVFRSADAGLHWKAVRGGLPQDFAALWIVIDPVSPRRMYLMTEGNSSGKVFFKSLDGGFSWQPMDDSFFPSDDFVAAFSTDPRSSRTLYAVPAAAAAVGRIYKSTDGGATWKATGTGLEGYVLTLLSPPGRPGSLYAGTDQGLFLSLDGGATWVRQPLRLPPSGGVDRLVASGQALLASIYGTGQRNGVFRSRDGGRSWAFSGRGISAMDVTAIVSGAPGTIWVLADFILFRSTDDGLTWRLIRTTLRPPVALAVDPTDRSKVFVADSGGAVWRSDDAGTTWEPAGNAGMYVYDLQVDPQTPSTLYAAGTQRAAGIGGIAKSTDRGDTWTRLSAEPARHHYEVHIAPSSPSTLYAAACQESFSCFLLRSTDAGATWTRMNFETDGILEPGLAVDPRVATTVYTTYRGNIHRSTDGGNTWSEIGDSANSNAAYPLVISDTGRLYAAAWLAGVVSYADGDRVGDLLGGRYFFNGFYALAPDPHDPCRLFAGPWARSLLVFRHTGIDGCPAP